MRNTSIFNGIKELNELTFISNGVEWDVFKDEDDARIFIGKIRKISRESNYALYNRALEIFCE